MRLVVPLILLFLVAWMVRNLIQRLKNTEPSARTGDITSVEINISDKTGDDLPSVSLRANGGILKIGYIKQDTADYIVSAERKGESEVVISFEKKVPSAQPKLLV